MLDALDPAALVDVAVVGEVFGVVGQGLLGVRRERGHRRVIEKRPAARDRHLFAHGIPVQCRPPPRNAIRGLGGILLLRGANCKLTIRKPCPRREGEPVLLGEPTRSDFDLRFHLFGVPVRVHPTFWLFSAILGWNWVDLGWEYLLL